MIQKLIICTVSILLIFTSTVTANEAAEKAATSEPQVQAEQAKPAGPDGKTLYVTCSACHGQNGEGNKALNSPAIAGQEGWYIKRQLNNFKAGIRGKDPKDIYGMQMASMAAILATEEMQDAVIEHIKTFPTPEIKPAEKGDSAAGKALYATCAVCHGQKGEGNKILNSPGLVQLQDWYLVRQLKNFKSGIRGKHPQDIYGMQMAPMAMTLVDDAAIDNVVSYIKTLKK